MSSMPTPSEMTRGDLEDEVRTNRQAIEDLTERVKALEEHQQSTATVRWDGPNPGELEIEPSKKGPTITPMVAIGGKMDEDQAFAHLEDLRNDIEKLKRGEIDREDLVGATGIDPEFPIEADVAEALDKSRRGDLKANQYRATYIFRAFGGHCESWSGVLKVTSADVRNIFKQKDELPSDPNDNTVVRSMKWAAKQTSKKPKDERDPFDEENLLRVRKGEQRLELVADKDEWHEYWDGVEDRVQQLVDGGGKHSP